MAMISLKNLVAPVRNSVHMATIVTIVLLFGAWRWSGGEVNFVRETRSFTTNNSSGRDKLPGRDVLVPKTDVARPTSSKGTISVPPEAADDLLGSILSNGGGANGAPRKNAGAAKEKPHTSSNSLEDIERSLGIK